LPLTINKPLKVEGNVTFYCTGKPDITGDVTFVDEGALIAISDKPIIMGDLKIEGGVVTEDGSRII